ncbi:unnamed protein product [Ilex paraguariensis]|uniref:Uncharacterized protein n=1 Tax=Ilex paraguariensis TaxID=185542 RepID=A0ABC8U5M0_9AQUA
MSEASEGVGAKGSTVQVPWARLAQGQALGAISGAGKVGVVLASKAGHHGRRTQGHSRRLGKGRFRSKYGCFSIDGAGAGGAR